MRIGGLDDLFELVTTAIEHGVPVPGKLTPHELEQAEEFTTVLRSFGA